MAKTKVSIQEYSSSKLAKLPAATEAALFEVSDKLNEHYNATVLACSKDRHGNVIIKTSSFVGVIDVDRTLAIEILPKIHGISGDGDTNLSNLFFMLGYSGLLSVPSKRSSSLQRHGGSFFEMLIAMFAEELLSKIQNSAHHEYVYREENRAYLRGKLVIPKHLKANGLVSSKFYTQTDEFTPNNTLNQLLKYVARRLYALTSDAQNKKRLRMCLALFDGVDDIRVTKARADRIQLTRLNNRFSGVLALAKLFISNQTLVSRSGSSDSWTILIDMNQLFEGFVAKALTNGLRGSRYKVTEQGPVKSFVYNVEDERKVFRTRPDISILEGGSVLRIADTKYKKLKQDDSKYGVSQPDLYQMFAYSRLYSTPDITLIYPKINDVQPHTLELPDATRVHIRTIDLSRDIKREIRQIEAEVVELFQQSKATTN